MYIFVYSAPVKGLEDSKTLDMYSMWMSAHTEAFSLLRKTPVDSTTNVAPEEPQGMFSGFLLAKRNNRIEPR